jgi:hypothetical protein
MTTKYAILDPQNGGYVYVETEAEIEPKKAEMAMNFYLSQTHNAPVSVVETDDEGQETWTVYASSN